MKINRIGSVDEEELSLYERLKRKMQMEDLSRLSVLSPIADNRVDSMLEPRYKGAGHSRKQLPPEQAPRTEL